MKKYITIFFVLFATVNFSFALTQLPKTSYLQYLDNSMDVQTLQQILNSDPDTAVASDGPGSPGHELSFFGALTLGAVKRFQEKYNLQITGKVDYKTLRILNAIVTNGTPSTAPTITTTSQTNTAPTQIQPTTDNSNPYLDNSNSNPYISDSTSQNSTPPVPAKPATTTSLTQTILNAILNKYSSLFSGSTNPATPSIQGTPDTYSNSYSAKTPYCNPQTGICSSNPAYLQTTQANSLTQNPYLTPYGSNNSNPYLSNSGNPYSSSGAPGTAGQTGQNGGFTSTLSNLLGGGPVTGGAENSAGATTGARGDIGQCQSTIFAHNTLARGCYADSEDQQNNQKAYSGQILSRSGVPAIPAVALPFGAGSMGDAVEVKIIKTGQCKAFPLLDRGPSNGQIKKGKCIDLTGSADDILKGKQPCKTVTGPPRGTVDDDDVVQYAVIPGDKIQPGQTKECTHLK